MANNPLNLAFRFLLEMAGLIISGMAAWQLASGMWRWIAAIGVPLAMAVVWGAFNVPGDPSRGGGAPVPVPGSARLAIEVGFFALAVILAWAAAMTVSAIALGTLVVLHYALSWDRMRWLLNPGA